MFRRIHIIFPGTALALSKCRRITLILMLSLLILMPLPMWTLNAILGFDQLDEMVVTACFFTWALSLLLYPVMAIYAVYIFESALLSLVKTQADPSRDITTAMHLNEHQQTLIAVTAYVLVLC